MKNQNIAILCSGVTLGVYNPALITRNKLWAIGQNPMVFVCENLFYDDKKNKISEMRKMFHRNFKFALMGQKMSGTVQANYNPDLIEELYSKWQKEDVKDFIVFSGFWMSILDEYLRKHPGDEYNVHIFHMDAVESESWKSVSYDSKYIHHTWFFSLKEKDVSNYFAISDNKIVPFEERDERFIIHGGGWGIGTYKQKVQKLESFGLKLDIINYEHQDIDKLNNVHRYFLIDPNWNAWEHDETGNYQFPPFGQIINNNEIEYLKNNDYPEVYNIIRKNVGIISKPGGATILDSLSSATPIIFLDPFGDYERKNAELMIDLGFGIWYEDWEKSSFSIESLEHCHNNLVKSRAHWTEFTDLYMKYYLKNTNQYAYEY